MLALGTFLRHLPKILALTLAAAAVWAHLALLEENTLLKSENALLHRSVASLEQQITQTRRAVLYEANRAEEFRLRSEELTGHIETILKGGIPDAPLDPALIELLDSLRPR
ncbi:MAG: hypothetical protein LPK02_07590 [Rhodobacterales bacterium]|nr:hypothetical protein [Rhodobacterales bacterium]